MTAYAELAVVIPLFNEEKNIASLIKDWNEVFTNRKINYEFIIINDGSTDNSLTLLESTASAIPGLKLTIHNQKNQGHGNAILNGYKIALRSEWIFQLDSDHQLDINAFNTLWDNRNDYDFLVGERKKKNGTFFRKFISWSSAFLVHLFYGRRVNDVNSPYRLMRSAQLEKALEKISSQSFSPNVLITAFFTYKKARIFTLNLSQKNDRIEKKSKTNINFFKGCIKSMFQTIFFRLKL